jgi:hypothetical protein
MFSDQGLLTPRENATSIIVIAAPRPWPALFLQVCLTASFSYPEIVPGYSFLLGCILLPVRPTV